MARNAEIKLDLNLKEFVTKLKTVGPELQKALNVDKDIPGVKQFRTELEKSKEITKHISENTGNLTGAYNPKNLQKWETELSDILDTSEKLSAVTLRLKELGVAEDGTYSGDKSDEVTSLLEQQKTLAAVYKTQYKELSSTERDHLKAIVTAGTELEKNEAHINGINSAYKETLASTQEQSSIIGEENSQSEQLAETERKVAENANKTADAMREAAKASGEANAQTARSGVDEATKNTSEGAKKANDEYEALRDTIIMLKADVMQVNDAMATDTASNNILELIRRYRTLTDAKKQMESVGMQTKDLDGTYATTVRLLAQLTDQIKAYKNNLSGTRSINEKSKKSTDNFSSALRGLNSTIKSIKSGFKSLNHSSKDVKSSFDKMANSMRSNFKHLITSITKYVLGFRSLFFLVRRLRKYIGEGIQNMAQFNDGNNHVNEGITRLLSSLLFLKNAWATAFSPILQFVTPILENLIDTLAEVGNAFSRFLGGLLGQTTVFQAVKVDAQDYADSLDKAAGSAGSAADKTKKLTDRLAAFDDLNVLGVDNDPDGTGSGGGGGGADAYLPDPNEMFKLVEVDNKHFIEQLKSMWERADFSDLGSAIKEKIMGALESIKWEDVYATVRQVMGSLGTFIVGLFGDPKFWEDLGDFGAGLFNAIIYGLQTFLETTEDTDFGGMIAQGLNGFLTKTDWKQAGLNVGKLGKQILDNLSSFIKTADKTAIASAISDFLSGVDIVELGVSIGKLILTVTELSIDIIGGIIVESALDLDNMSPDQIAYVTESWTNLLRKILKAVVNALTVGTGLGGVITSLLAPPKDENGNTDWEQIGYDIADGLILGLGKSLKKIGENDWIRENIYDPFWNAISNIFDMHSPSKVTEEWGGWIGEGILNGISNLIPNIKQIFTDLKDWLVGTWETIKTDATTNWNTLRNNISSAVTTAKTNITTTLETWRTSLETTWFNIRTTAVSNFWTMKSKIVEAFEALRDGAKNIINNGILPVVEDMINFLIDGLNSFIDRLNSIPDITFRSPFTGEDITLGVDLSHIGHVSVPRLAQGAVIPPNREFMAVLGDQSHGTNIEAPLDTIKQAVAEVLANNGNAEMIQLLQQLITVVENKKLAIGDKEIAKANQRYVNQQKMIRGTTY